MSALLALLLATSPAVLPEPLAALFPARGDVRLDGPPRALRSADRRTIRLTPVRYEPAPGRSQAVNAFRCGLLIAAEGGRPDPVETVGLGDSEALSCDGIADAGLVEAGHDGRPRVALLYRVRSPNEAGRLPVVLRWDKTVARWTLDGPASSRLAARPDVATLAAIRRALRSR